jgi:putative tRNA adenosine deaminase-associated protein
MTNGTIQGVDFAIAAYREDGEWQVGAMPPRAADDLETLLKALRQLPGDTGAMGLVSVDEDHFVLARVQGSGVRLLLSDVTAATAWPLARSVVDHLGLPAPDDDDDYQPAGDMSILADLGLAAMDLGALIDHDDLYPDEMLGDIADQAGFGSEFASVLETAAS